MPPKKARTMRQLVADAKKYLRQSWVEGSWCTFDTKEGPKSWGPGNDTWEDLQSLIKEAKEANPNPKCSVCAQGAVYLACAVAGDEDSSRAREIIYRLNDHAPGETGSIMESNDSFADDVEELIPAFDAVEKEFADV